jgi:hypothetical protein
VRLELAASHSLLRNRVNGADLQLYIRFVELQRYLTENTANVCHAWYHADRRASGTEAAGVGNTITGGELIRSTEIAARYQITKLNSAHV